MLLRRAWMWLALTLAMLIGLSAGVIADRLVVKDRLEARERGGHSSRFLWFSCDGGDVEQDPAYPYQPRYRAWLVDRLSARLELDPEQVGELGSLLDDRRGEARQFWGETRDAYCRMQTSLRDDVRTLLKPEQVETYEQLLRHVDERHRQRLQEDGSRSGRRSNPERPARSSDSCR